MENETLIKDCKAYIKEIFGNDSSGHDYLHSIRVYENALFILQDEKEADRLIVSLASLLHDTDDVKLFSENTNNENTRKFLDAHDIDKDTRERIVQVINEVSFKGKDTKVPSTVEGKIVQDADRLDAIGAIGIARTFMYGGSHNRSIYSEDDGFKDELTEEEYRHNSHSTRQHFYDKLLKLKDMMNTNKGKEMAEKRHEYMLGYLEELEEEIQGAKIKLPDDFNKNGREKVLVSACLLGTACRYDGKSKKYDAVKALCKYVDLIPVCPEELGGLSTPRAPSEIKGSRVVNSKGYDVTSNFEEGAYWAMAAAKSMGVRLAILKQSSPSCGSKDVYDGTFTNKKIPGQGITAKKLISVGIQVIDENEAEILLKQLEDNEEKM